MEKSGKVLREEFDNLIYDMRTLVLSGRDEFAHFHQTVEDDIGHVTGLLEKLTPEKQAHEVLLNELAAKAKQSEMVLRQFIGHEGDFTLQDMKTAYEKSAEIQVRLAVAQEQERFLERHYEELTARLQGLREKQERAAKLAKQMDTLVDDFNQMMEMEDVIQGLVQSQNFGFKIITAQEEERRRVAREIHDGPAQAMANVIFLAEVCERLLDIDTARAKRELFELRQQVRSCLTETRKIIFDLRPMVLDDLGLIPTVKRIADNLKERGIQTSVKLTGMHSQPLDSRIEVSLFRIIQESINNIEKHAQATEVEVRMDFQRDYVMATVKDNGKGFEFKDNHYESESFGLLGMRERVSLLKGELDIQSEIGAGTKVTVKIPIVTTTEKLIIT